MFLCREALDKVFCHEIFVVYCRAVRQRYCCSEIENTQGRNQHSSILVKCIKLRNSEQCHKFVCAGINTSQGLSACGAHPCEGGLGLPEHKVLSGLSDPLADPQHFIIGDLAGRGKKQHYVM